MGRRIKIRDDDYYGDTSKVVVIKDDRKKAENIRTNKQLDLFLDRNGAVARQITSEGGFENPLVEYAPDGTRRVNKKNTQKAVLQLREEITNSRYYEKSYIDDTIQNTKITEGKRPLTAKEKENLNKREYQTRAIGLLTVIRTGDVKVSNYDKGILNRLAAGKYNDVVYGKKQSNGTRRYERGTFRNKVGLNRGSIRSATPEGRARAKEKADQLLRRGRYEDRYR